VKKLTVGLILIGLSLTGCGALGTTAPSTAASAADSFAATGSPTDDAVSTIHVEVQGGPLVGSYDASSASPICTWYLAAEGSFGIEYSVDQPEGLVDFEVLLPAAALAASGTDDFTMTIGLGELSGGTTFHIDPVADGTTANARLDYDGGSSATMHVEAETAEGIGISVDAECRQVVRL
jgi:hypothetical protein